MTAPQPYRLPCGCQVWPADGTRGDYLQLRPGCPQHDRQPVYVPVPVPTSRGLSGAGTLLVVLAILGIGYVALHAYTYRTCMFAPGIFQWPSVCL